MTDYVYAPKDDPKHRERWRDPYDADELAGFERFAAEASAAARVRASRPASAWTTTTPPTEPPSPPRSTRWSAVGAGLVVLALDDIPFGGGPQGEAHARVTTWLRRSPRRGAPTSSSCPTEYVGTRPSPQLEALAAGRAGRACRSRGPGVPS